MKYATETYRGYTVGTAGIRRGTAMTWTGTADRMAMARDYADADDAIADARRWIDTSRQLQDDTQTRTRA